MALAGAVSDEGERLRAWAESVIEDMNPDALFFEGPGDSDRAIVGIATKGPGLASIVYDQDLLIETMVEAFSADKEGPFDPLDVEQEAWDWLEFNTKGAWMGESTPWVLMRSPSEPERTEREPDQAHFG